MKDYVIRNKQTGELLDLKYNQVITGVRSGIPAIVTSYYYSKPEYIDLNTWEVIPAEELEDAEAVDKQLKL